MLTKWWLHLSLLTEKNVKAYFKKKARIFLTNNAFYKCCSGKIFFSAHEVILEVLIHKLTSYSRISIHKFPVQTSIYTVILTICRHSSWNVKWSHCNLHGHGGNENACIVKKKNQIPSWKERPLNMCMLCTGKRAGTIALTVWETLK